VLLGSQWGECFVNLCNRYFSRLAAAISVRPSAGKVVRALLWPVVLLSSIWPAVGLPGALAFFAAMLLTSRCLLRMGLVTLRTFAGGSRREPLEAA
jgi:hypothetical protein